MSYVSGRAKPPLFRALFCVALVPAAPGCSLFAPHSQLLTVTATDLAAEIFVDGQSIGIGTASVRVARNQDHSVVARVGDRTGVARTGTAISTTGILDLLGGSFFLIPFIGAAGPGFWKLDPDSVTVLIPPK